MEGVVTLAQVREVIEAVGLPEAIETIEASTIEDPRLRQIWTDIEVLYGEIMTIVKGG